MLSKLECETSFCLCPCSPPPSAGWTPLAEVDTPFNMISTLKRQSSLRPRKLQSVEPPHVTKDADGGGEETAANVHLFFSRGGGLMPVEQLALLSAVSCSF